MKERKGVHFLGNIMYVITYGRWRFVVLCIVICCITDLSLSSMGP